MQSIEATQKKIVTQLTLVEKINADIFIDDRNYGGAPEWGEIYQHLSPSGNAPEKKKWRWFKS